MENEKLIDSIEISGYHQYIIVRCVEREIEQIGGIFYDRFEAALVMKEDFINAIVENEFDLDDEEDDDSFFANEKCLSISDCDFGFDENGAWLNGTYDYDWKIITL